MRPPATQGIMFLPSEAPSCQCALRRVAFVSQPKDRVRQPFLETGVITELLEKLLEESETKIIPIEEFRHQESMAKEISPDPDDVAYLALALHLGCPLWSNDKALKKQTKVKVYSTQELLQRLEQ